MDKSLADINLENIVEIIIIKIKNSATCQTMGCGKCKLLNICEELKAVTRKDY